MTAFWMFWFFSFCTHASFSGITGAASSLVKWCVCVPGEIGSERCEASGLCDAGNLGDSSPWDMHFPSSKPSSSPDSKVVQILPLSPGVLHQNNGIGQDADFQGIAKAGSTIPWNFSNLSPLLPLLEVLHSLPQHRDKTERCFLMGHRETQAAAESWHVSLKVQNNLLGISQVPSDDEDA